MDDKKLTVVHYLNQFFGQIGGEDKATTGFVVKEGPVGPGMLLQKELGDRGNVVATVICGDDCFASNMDNNAEEGLRLVASYKPDLFFAGPSFAGGRYGVACGAMCKAVNAALGIPVITGMNEENPGVEIYRKYAFICKAPNIARGMPDVLRTMVRLAFRLLSGEREMRILAWENLPKPEEYGYFSRNLLRNEYCDKSIAERAVEKLVAKLQGKPFESEVNPPVFEKVPPPRCGQGPARERNRPDQRRRSGAEGEPRRTGGAKQPEMGRLRHRRAFRRVRSEACGLFQRSRPGKAGQAGAVRCDAGSGEGRRHREAPSHAFLHERQLHSDKEVW